MSNEQDEKTADQVQAVIDVLEKRLPKDSMAARFLGKITRHEVILLIGIIELILEPIRTAIGM